IGHATAGTSSTSSLSISLRLVSILPFSILPMPQSPSAFSCFLWLSSLVVYSGQGIPPSRHNHRENLHRQYLPQTIVEHSTHRKSMMHNPDPSFSHEKDTLSVQADEAGQRLDRYLVSKLTAISRTRAQQLIADGMVLVNGGPGKPGYALRIGDEIQILSPRQNKRDSGIKPQSLPLDVVYEDRDLLIINKAAGMVVHPAPGHHDDTLVNALLARYPDIHWDTADQRPGIIHRLDKDTSGLIIVARNIATQAALVEQMKRHEIVKRYLALVEGVVALDQGSIDAPIGRDPRHRQQMTITALGSREARTHFRVLERFARHTLLLLELETGRTHQIRVHLKAIGHPIAGDPVYGSGNTIRGLSLKRQFLHAYQLKFTHPITGASIDVEVPLPDDLQVVLNEKSFL